MLGCLSVETAIDKFYLLYNTYTYHKEMHDTLSSGLYRSRKTEVVYFNRDI